MNYFDAIAAQERYYASIPYTETGTNHQRFSDTVNAYGLAGCQNQAWCATYQFSIELETVGKEQALKNWHMASNYCGYSVFETEAAFLRVGRTGATPKVGALVIFKRSHMGRVLSISGNTFECGEGNTSNREFNRDGDACAVKTYAVNDSGIKSFCYIDYPDFDMNANDIINATKNVYLMAHNGHYRYGDSKAMPPCADGIISCDRLIARALYNLGFTNQPQGGITVISMERYLKGWGFSVIKDYNALKAGDIVLMRDKDTTPNAGWHTFLLTAFVNANNVSKYDMGSQDRINASQPFTFVPLNQWPNAKWFYCAFRWGKSDEYVINPATLKLNSNNNSAYLMTEILKARGYKGAYKDGKQQELELNFKWTVGDMAAMAQYKADRTKNKVNLSKGPYGGGEVGPADWTDVLGGAIPFALKPLPDKQTKGTSVLLCQEILKGRGFKGKDGKALDLDREWGDNTKHAVKAYQKAIGVSQTGKVDAALWKRLTGL